MLPYVLPKKIGRLIPAIMFATTIATPALGYVDYICNCGAQLIDNSWLLDRPTCGAAPDYLTEYCVLSKSNTSFTYRMPTTAGIPACNLCSCGSKTGTWVAGSNGALTKTTTKTESTSSTRCDWTTEIEAACNSGYYGLYEPDFMIYACEECPWLEDKYGTMIHGMTEYANTSPNITACYIPKEQVETGAWFEDASGDYVITDDCYYVE